MKLELVAVEHAYGPTDALRGVSLTVAGDEVVAITGASGSGKSTLLHVAAGLIAPRSGGVWLLGQDLRGLNEAARTRLRRRRVGIVLQFGQLVPDLSAVENVALPLLLDGAGRRDALRAAADWLERVELGPEAAQLASELSGGQAQRAAVARALVAGPELIFADEPTGSLDSEGGTRLLELLLGAARSRGAAVVLVTHEAAVAARADREVRLRDGLVAASTVVS
jgi:putative ABC transport system ATP-binding protein